MRGRFIEHTTNSILQNFYKLQKVVVHGNNWDYTASVTVKVDHLRLLSVLSIFPRPLWTSLYPGCQVFICGSKEDQESSFLKWIQPRFFD
ncbi:hypothetical protein AgCh_015353 [Apium graveolens]